jgi:mRNA-degrading endonuclease toxin of MazEF toxin-antitoxin module
MRAISSGEVWQVDFGLAAKVRPALLLTSNPADEELDLVTVDGSQGGGFGTRTGAGDSG